MVIYGIKRQKNVQIKTNDFLYLRTRYNRCYVLLIRLKK